MFDSLSAFFEINNEEASISSSLSQENGSFHVEPLPDDRRKWQ